MARKAVIVGGSMGGLLAGNLLIRGGWDVTILERTSGGLQSRGAGIAPQRSLLDTLERAGVSLNTELGVAIEGRVGYRADGSRFATHSYEQITTSWGLIYNLLKDAFPASDFHAGRQVVSVTQDADTATAILEDGSAIEADLLIGADGMWSVVRRLLFPTVQPRYAGYIAWRGMIDEALATPDIVADAFSRFSFSFPEGEEFIGYPVAGPGGTVAPGHRRFNFMWYRPVDEATGLPDLFTGTDGVRYQRGIPPALIRPELIRQAKQAAARLLPPRFADVVGRVEELFFQAIFDLESEEMGTGRIALIGDAAFVARPHCGAGVSKAAADADALARALTAHEDVPSAVAAFSAERAPEGRAAVAWAARLGGLFQTPGAAGELSAAERDQNHAFIIRHTGIELSEAYQLDAGGKPVIA